MKKIEDYIHLYIGQEIETGTGKVTLYAVKKEIIPCTNFGMVVLNGNITHGLTWDNECKLILRPLSDMTEEEKNYIDELQKIEDEISCPLLRVHKTRHGEQLRYLLSKGFDLFGLIDAGLAITKTPAAI